MPTTSLSFDCPTCGKSYASQASLKRHVCKLGFVCEFCNKSFVSEQRLLNHSCEQKRRYLLRNEKVEKLGFAMYQRMYEKTMHSKQPRTDQSFRRSRLYGGFVKFARYVLHLDAPRPFAFLDFLLHFEVPMKRWTEPELYSRYIRELNKNETLDQAIERNVMLMREWASSTGQNPRDFFRLIAPPQATSWIINGLISPWLLFTASSGVDLLRRLNKEQRQLVEKAIDNAYWQAKIARNQSEVDHARRILAEGGI